MDLNKLKEIRDNHANWLKDPATGIRADLSGADLHYADLRYADLSGADLHDANLYGADLADANLTGADLHDADLSGANLYGADLSDASLHDANLHDADLRYADLRRANLRDANLSGANLHDANLTDAYLRRVNLRYANLHDANPYGADLARANLTGANLRGANLRYANLSGADLADVKTDENTLGFHPVCPADGEFVGWKKADGLIVKLKVPTGAKRRSATTNKCRCSKAEVLAIEELDGTPSSRTKAASDWDQNFVYEVGKTVEVNDFDENRWNECSTGIHFFMTRGEAAEW